MTAFDKAQFGFIKKNIIEKRKVFKFCIQSFFMTSVSQLENNYNE